MIVSIELVRAAQQEVRADVARAGHARPHGVRDAVRRIRTRAAH